MKTSLLFLLLGCLAVLPKIAQAQQSSDEIGALIQNSVVKACDELNKKKRPHCLAAAPKTEPTKVLSRCDRDRTDAPPSTTIKNLLDNPVEMSALSEEEAQEVFHFVSQQKSRYGLSGTRVADRVCAQRAQLVAYDLADSCKIKSAKIFIRPSRSLAALGLWRNPLTVEANGRTYHWDNYHVANIVMVRKDGQTLPYVIDPLLFQNPVPLEEWKSLVTKSDPRASSTITSASTYLLSGAYDDNPGSPVIAGPAETDLARARSMARELQKMK